MHAVQAHPTIFFPYGYSFISTVPILHSSSSFLHGRSVKIYVVPGVRFLSIFKGGGTFFRRKERLLRGHLVDKYILN